MSTEVRLPLQTGETAFWRLLLVGGGLTLVAGPLIEWAGTVRSWEYFVAAMPFYWLIMFGPILAARLLLRPRTIPRASDCYVDTKGFRLVGGKYDKLKVSWSDVVLARTGVEEGVLWLDLGVLERLPIAVAASSTEAHSIEALVETFHYRKRGNTSTAPTPNREASVLRCAQCGGHVAVEDCEALACPWCRAQVQVPPGLRERLRKAREFTSDRERVERIVRKMIGQPSARSVNRLLVVLGTLSIVWLPVPAIIQYWPLVTASVAVTLVLALWVYAVIAERRVLVLVSLDFAAREADTPGAPSCCRICGGPLSRPSDDHIVVECIYCNAINIVGQDLHAKHRIMDQAEKTLDKAFSAYSRSLLRARLAVAAGALLLVGASYWVLR